MYKQNTLLNVMDNIDLTVINGDVRDLNLLEGNIKKNDIIIPLAAIVGAPACNKDTQLSVDVNQAQARNIINFTSNSQKIIFPVTNSGYGIGEKDVFCDEKSELRPISVYGKTKVEAEKFFLDNGNAVTFRLATVFGSSPRMRMDLLVNDFVYRAFKDKFIVLFESHFKRNFIHIKDVCLSFLHGINNYSLMKGEPFNVGLSNANLSKMELCMEIKNQISDFHIFESDIAEDPDKRDYIVKRISKKYLKILNNLEKTYEKKI